MDAGLKLVAGLMSLVLLAVLSVQSAALAKSQVSTLNKNDQRRYIVVLDDPPLASYDGRVLETPERTTDTTRLRATAGRFTARGKLDVNSVEARQYLRFLDERFISFRDEASLRLGRQLRPVHRYRNATNGFVTDLSVAEARALREMPRVQSVTPDGIQKLHTDSGPAWLGADILHQGDAGFPPSGGEGMVVGIIDSGINWDHPSFADPGEGIPPGSGVWDHVNPYGSELGLCSDPEVLCNDKLVGVYDLVEDDPNTDVVEESNKGKDSMGHGSHVASVVAGNPTDAVVNGVTARVSGVAPNANIITYRVCFTGDESDPNDDGCQVSAILAAIDQAIADGVDIVNHSMGGQAHDPWLSSTSTHAFLGLRAAGIFAATSAGNTGPSAGTTGSPANAPWITAVGAATHDRVFASALENLSGGDTTPPGTLIGQSENDGIGIRKIVHAKDYGYALCGTGIPESGVYCSDNTGISNPFAAGTFNGEIVVCDRGTYGRVEKGKNLLLAGAGGYILANTDAWAESTYLDNLCLPSTHIGAKDAGALRAWLDSGTGHQGAISGFSIFHVAEAGDIIASFSSRGPALPPVEDVMKPDVIAPGVQVFGASNLGDNYMFSNGTSFASPHVAGAAALLRSIHPDWTPAMIHSALLTTATPELAVDFDDSPENIHKRGAGRPRLDLAVNAGLYLDVSQDEFASADPGRLGDPRMLNLPGLIDSSCLVSCEFQRTVTDLAGGASWAAAAEGLTEGVNVSISPVSFTLADGGNQTLAITVDLSQVELVGQWVYGNIRLTSNGLPDAVLPLAVYDGGGELPDEWVIDSNSVSGWQDFPLSGLVRMPDATFSSGGLVAPFFSVDNLVEDPGGDDIYDGPEGIMTVWHTVPADALWLRAETLASTSLDIDLYMGLDRNLNGKPDPDEQLCASESESDIEYCDVLTPLAGNYWIIAQNRRASAMVMDEVTIRSAVVDKSTNSGLTATGDGIIPGLSEHTVRLSWDNVSAVPGVELIGAVGIGTNRETPFNIGIIPVSFTKTSVQNPETLILMSGLTRGVTIDANATHKRIVLDIPPGVSSFTLTTSATGIESGINQALSMELYRIDFNDAFVFAPEAADADTSGEPLAFAWGTNDIKGPILMKDNPTAGRWYVVLKNSGAVAADVEIRADLSFTGSPLPLSSGLWQPSSRPDLNQGFDYATTGDYRAFLWYTYEHDGTPAWYLASGPEPVGNVWVAELKRFTNDGILQHSTPVGHVSVTMLSAEDSVFSFVLFGEEGTDRMYPSSPPMCPTVNDVKMSYTGIWSRPAIGVGGASALANEVSQGYLHYIYDAAGKPVWLLSTNEADGLPHAEIPLLQYSGYCAVCSGPEPTNREVGVFTIDYADEDSASWNLNYMLDSPLSGSIDRTDVTEKLTVPLICQ